MVPARHRFTLALLVALMVHGGVAAWIGPAPPKPPRVEKAPQEIQKLKAIRETVEIPKPEPPPPPPPPEPKPEPPPEPKPEAPKPKPKKKRKRIKRAKAKPKVAPKPEVTPPKVEPAPLVLENVNLTGKIAVQQGDSDSFGDPSVKATKTNTRPMPNQEGEEEGEIDAPKAPPKRVLPKPKRAVKGRYPEDAPRLGRTVEVKLSLRVGADGKVKKVKIVRGAGAAFDRAAKIQARRIVFSPGTLDGVPKAMWVPWTFAFQPE